MLLTKFQTTTSFRDGKTITYCVLAGHAIQNYIVLAIIKLAVATLHEYTVLYYILRLPNAVF